ncbi:hypothetical protein BAUCODRAFT_276525 [Baudoinia panamericana UAMH 10762]|uniref:F-box domain-containing protein n=1 Tax=Baudoinia panamericana (strain UAMH 10762) TaxID=717646 RepID=M2ML73_BAUPA|nr:uncharacterized protein BAUCODRAFT_276525 [Baudoinia panamericana UAMH 10762]EMC92118.1 hypothetical protein BAUCODRAFT_276525 [Baudoinia panamericana UAMH 10762]
MSAKHLPGEASDDSLNGDRPLTVAHQHTTSVNNPQQQESTDMANFYLSPAPADPYANANPWRESVLSTRSLSSLTVDALGSPGIPTRSRSGSLTNSNYFNHPMRTITDTNEEEEEEEEDEEDEEGEEDLEMSGTRRSMYRQLSAVPEQQLPDSVAQCGLFRLPRELRDKIYAYCLTSPAGTTIDWLHKPPPTTTNNKLPTLHPQLLRTCHVIHSETAPLLHTTNPLLFHHPSDANMFVRAFANTPLAQTHTHTLHLHIRASDTRLWMPYLTSRADGCRGLRADFPRLRELSVRFRSNRWDHSLSPDQNLRNWSEDGKLEELVGGLRQVFYPPPPPPARSVSRGDGEGETSKPLNGMDEVEFMRFVDARRPGEDMAFKRQLLELHKANAPMAVVGRSRRGRGGLKGAYGEEDDGVQKPTVVRVVCACRVHAAHFGVVTAAATGRDGGHAAMAIAPAVNPAHNHAGGQNLPPPPPPPPPHQHQQHHQQPPPPPAPPIEPSSTPIQLQIQKFMDPDLGSARVARTPFVDKGGVLVALEIHCLDSGR